MRGEAGAEIVQLLCRTFQDEFLSYGLTKIPPGRLSKSTQMSRYSSPSYENDTSISICQSNRRKKLAILKLSL